MAVEKNDICDLIEAVGLLETAIMRRGDHLFFENKLMLLDKVNEDKLYGWIITNRRTNLEFITFIKINKWMKLT